MPANELIQGHFSLSNEQTTGLVNDYFKAHRHSARFYMTPNQIELKLPISYMGIKSNASFKANVEKRPNGDLRLKVKEVKMSKIHIPITLALSLLPYTDINRYIELNATHHIVDISSEKVSNELGLLLEVDRLDEDGLKVSVKIPYERVKHFIQLGGQ